MTIKDKTSSTKSPCSLALWSRAP